MANSTSRWRQGENGAALLRIVFTIAILLGVSAMAMGLLAAGYAWVAPTASPLPITDTITPPDRNYTRGQHLRLPRPPQHRDRPTLSPGDRTLVA